MRTYSVGRELRDGKRAIKRESTLLRLVIAPFSYVNIDIHDLPAWTMKVKKHHCRNTVAQQISSGCSAGTKRNGSVSGSSVIKNHSSKCYANDLLIHLFILNPALTLKVSNICHLSLHVCITHRYQFWTLLADQRWAPCPLLTFFGRIGLFWQGYVRQRI